MQAEGGAKPRVETAKAARSGAAGFKLPVLLRRRLPTEHRHGNVVGAAQIALHLRLQVGKGIEAQVVVEAFLIVPMASFNLAVVPRCPRSEHMVINMAALAKHIEGMHTLCLGGMCEFRSAVGLNFLGSVPEVCNGSLDEINR